MNLFGNQNLNEILNKLFKIGEVSSINPAKGTARVVFDDEDSVVSYDLPVLQRNTIKNQDYAMPDIGEDVACLFLPCGSEDGFILGSFYAGEITPPESDGNKRTVVFADNTRISYDRDKHILTVTIGKTSIVADQSNVNVSCSGTADISAGTVNATASGNATISASSATVKASTINLTGNVTVQGNLTVSGNVTSAGSVSAVAVSAATVAATSVSAGGKSFETHTHMDSTNSPTSGPV